MNREQRKDEAVLFIAMVGMLLLSLWPASLKGQEVAVKTNFLQWGTLSPNLGVEAVVGKKTTLEIPVSYNPWTFSENKKWKHILVQPEIRRWTCEPFNGHFFGLHAHYARYNVGNVDLGNVKFPVGVHMSELNNYRYDGWLVGAGLTYGYQLYLGPRFNLELAIGAGYAYLNYSKYECPRCGELIGDGEKHYIGPTKAAASLIYLIK